MTCDCISYNNPQPDQKTPSVVMTAPAWAGWHKPTICVDACISHHVQALWDAHLWTLGSCCGHNGRFQRSVIVDQADHVKAQALLSDRGADVHVLSWQLCRTPPRAAHEKRKDTP